jgi:AcrR family transcriptional regulator
MAARKKSKATSRTGKKAAAPRRVRVLDAARALFLERGYGATHILDVAKKAGFSKRAVYLDFPSKGALYATLYEEAIERLRTQLQGASDAERDVAGKIHAIAEAYLRFYREERGAYRLLFVWRGDILDDAPPTQQQRLRDLEAACVDVLAGALARAKSAGLIRDELDPWRFAVAVWGAQNGVLLVEEQGRLDVARATTEDLYWTSYGALVRGALAT